MRNTATNRTTEHKGTQTMTTTREITDAAQKIAALEARKAEVLEDAARHVREIDEQIDARTEVLMRGAESSQIQAREVYEAVKAARLDLAELDGRLFRRLAATNTLDLDATPATTQRWTIVAAAS
jgi:hypothetical protein